MKLKDLVAFCFMNYAMRFDRILKSLPQASNEIGEKSCILLEQIPLFDRRTITFGKFLTPYCCKFYLA